MGAQVAVVREGLCQGFALFVVEFGQGVSGVLRVVFDVLPQGFQLFEADEVVRGEAGRAVAIDADIAACRRKQAEQHFHQGRFTSAVVSGKGDHFAGVDVDVHLVYGGEVTEGFAELCSGKDGTHAGDS